MSNFFENVSDKWPDVDWQGRSSIHVSVWNDKTYTGKTKRQVLKAAYDDGMAREIFNTITGQFPGFEWLISPEEFENRCYVDLYRHSKGMGDTQYDTKLVNPSTGNVFHRIALVDHFIGGIRFWMEGHDGGQVSVGYRFRIQQLDETEVDLRDRANKQAIADGITMAEVIEEMEIAEPKKAKNKLAELEVEDFIDSALEGEAD